MAQDDDLELPLTTAGEHADEAAQKPVQQRHQHDAQSEPARPQSPTRPSRPESNFFTPQGPRVRRLGIFWAPFSDLRHGRAHSSYSSSYARNI